MAELLPPLLWLGVIYIGSLIALLLQSFFSIDEFTGLVNREFTLKTYVELLRPANLDIIARHPRHALAWMPASSRPIAAWIGAKMGAASRARASS